MTGLPSASGCRAATSAMNAASARQTSSIVWPGIGLRQEADEVAGMARRQRDADLAVVLHAADAGPVAGARVDDDEGRLGRIDRLVRRRQRCGPARSSPAWAGCGRRGSPRTRSSAHSARSGCCAPVVVLPRSRSTSRVRIERCQASSQYSWTKLRLLVGVMVGLRLGSEWHPKAGKGWNAGTIVNSHRDVAMSVPAPITSFSCGDGRRRVK